MLRPIGTQFEAAAVVDWHSANPPCEVTFVCEVVGHFLWKERCEVVDIRERPLEQRFVDGVLIWYYADDGTPYTGDLP